MGALSDKTIVVGVSGGIAAYKAAELVRLLASAGAVLLLLLGGLLFFQRMEGTVADLV